MSTDEAVVEGFNELVGALEYPMFVVTARDGDERSGCLVGFVTQCSIDPPRVLVCLSVQNHTFGVAERADHLAVHVVPADRRDLAELFGGRTGDEVDKFAEADLRWHDGPAGLPVLDDCPGWFVGSVRERLPLGDHVGFLLDPVASSGAEPGPQLSSRRAMTIDAGHDA